MALFHHADPNLVILMATVAGATVALMISFSRIRRDEI
ncbi:hypothetical protein Thpro_020573 [Acidihalobacter prosperus]|uniref:Uncharacterized protein n=1 Tax=Acidihalobacter prosperus TaxID=160660 RepID=A0A1A6C8G2_9GAMM|nr:hypothetical protein Thpro_020573 [Acidihalobacter prosperus]